MRFGTLTMTLVGGLVLAAGPALAQMPSQASKPSPHAAQTMRGRKTASDHTLVGSVVKFDVSAKRLTLKTEKGEEVVAVGTSTRINEGPKKLSAADLGSLTGYQAKVRYREESGHMVADSIMVSREVAK